MNAEIIAATYDFTYMVLCRNTEGITHQMSLCAPEAGGNCMNWVIGHILANRTPILKLVGQDPIWSATDAAPYMRGSSPLTPANVASARPFEELVADLTRSQERLKAGFATMTPDKLARPGLPGVPGGDQPVGAQLAIFNFHESYHAGQTGILRRLAGLAGAIK